MSLRQFLVGLKQQFARFRQLYHARLPWTGIERVLPAQQAFRVPRPLPLPAASAWKIPTSAAEFRKRVLRVSQKRQVAYLRTWAARPGRVTVAPLLGFIAAFLQVN